MGEKGLSITISQGFRVLKVVSRCIITNVNRSLNPKRNEIEIGSNSEKTTKLKLFIDFVLDRFLFFPVTTWVSSDKLTNNFVMVTRLDTTTFDDIKIQATHGSGPKISCYLLKIKQSHLSLTHQFDKKPQFVKHHLELTIKKEFYPLLKWLKHMKSFIKVRCNELIIFLSSLTI